MYVVAIFSLPNGPELQAPSFLYPNKSVPKIYCKIISKLTNVAQIKEDKKNLFRFITLLKKRQSITKIKSINLVRKRALKVGFPFTDIHSSILNEP